MYRILVVCIAWITLASFVSTSAEACGKTRRPPKPPTCSASAVGNVSTAANGQATVRFSSGDGLPLASSIGMTLAATEGCLCAVAVRRAPDVDVSGVTFPVTYPSFSLETGTSRAQNAVAFVEHYLTRAGRDPDNYEIVVFTTPTGGTIPSNLDFDIDVDYAIPNGSYGEEIAQDEGVIGFFSYDGDQVVAEPSGDGSPISFAQYVSPGFDLTEASVFLTTTSIPTSAGVGTWASATGLDIKVPTGSSRSTLAADGISVPPAYLSGTVELDFEAGAPGWVNAGASTCSTGAYVLGTPTRQVSTVVTQPSGDHTSGTGNALFTATNSSVGVDDVDGGNCILLSPTWNVPNASTLRVWYFHGQRDAGDDPSGDFFRLDLSNNGGSTFSPLVSIGDVRTVADWTVATAQIPAGSSVQLRLEASDGAGPGDIVEAGLDDLTICPIP